MAARLQAAQRKPGWAAATSLAPAINGQPPGGVAIPNRNEPVKITGIAESTFPLVESYSVEPYVLLEDEAGFVNRDYGFELAPENQVMGPRRKDSDGQYQYTLHLPAQPVGTLVDVSRSGRPTVMVFAVGFLRRQPAPR